MNIITSKTENWERVYETEDSFGEYQIFKKKNFYLFGLKIWSYNFDYEDRGIHEWLQKNF